MRQTDPLLIELDTIERTLARWCDFDRSRGGGQTPDSVIMAPPTWPSHGMLENWIVTLRKAQLRIAQGNQ